MHSAPCAQLAVSKLLWDLYCRNALAGNSSLSFILFVCVKFPLWPHPFSHPVPGFVHPSMGALCQCWLHPGGCNHIRARARLPPGSFFTSHLHLPDLLTAALTCSVFYCTGKRKKANAAPRFSGPLLASHGRERERGVGVLGGDWERQGGKEGGTFHEESSQATTQFAFSSQTHQ